MKTREPKLLTIADGTLLEPLTEGFEWRGFGEPCRKTIVCPIRRTTGENAMGFLVVGVNPRRPFDDDYQSFIRLLDRQLATSLASVTFFWGRKYDVALQPQQLPLWEDRGYQQSSLSRGAVCRGLLKISDFKVFARQNVQVSLKV